MKKQKRNKILVVVVFVVIIFIIVTNLNNEQEEITVVSSINDYNYNLESNETRIYKKYFNELEQELSDNKIDEEKYAILVSKLFLIDFYTLNNKVTNQDVGGLQFISDKIKDSFYDKAINTMYKYVKSNIYGNRYQKLPEVKDIEIEEIRTIVYKVKEIEDNNAYQVKTKINYKKDLDYQEEVILTLVHEDNKLNIINIL